MATRKVVAAGQGYQKEEPKTDRAQVPEVKTGICIKSIDSRTGEVEVEFDNIPLGLCSVRLVDKDFHAKNLGDQKLGDEYLRLTYELWGTDWTITQNVYYKDSERDKTKNRFYRWKKQVDEATGGKFRRETKLAPILEWLEKNWVAGQVKEFYNKDSKNWITFLTFKIDGVEGKASNRI